jgi:hypothetical protein
MEILVKEISELGMAYRTHNSISLGMPEIKTVKDLVLTPEGQLLRLPRFGRKSLNDVKYGLREHGLYLGMVEADLPKDMDAISKEFTYNVIHHAEEASKQSFEVITQKKEWNKKDIEKFFNSHKKIMMIYKESLERLFS